MGHPAGSPRPTQFLEGHVTADTGVGRYESRGPASAPVAYGTMCE